MKKEDLLKELREKEELKAKTELIFHQLTGQIALLRDLINREVPESPKES